MSERSSEEEFNINVGYLVGHAHSDEVRAVVERIAADRAAILDGEQRAQQTVERLDHELFEAMQSRMALMESERELAFENIRLATALRMAEGREVGEESLRAWDRLIAEKDELLAALEAIQPERTLSCRRYTTDDQHVLTIWDADGHTWDVRWPR